MTGRLPVAAPAAGPAVLRIRADQCWADAPGRGWCRAPSTDRLGLCKDHAEEILG